MDFILNQFQQSQDWNILALIVLDVSALICRCVWEAFDCNKVDQSLLSIMGYVYVAAWNDLKHVDLKISKGKSKNDLTFPVNT